MTRLFVWASVALLMLVAFGSVPAAARGDKLEILERVEPVFPAKAQKAGLNGYVVLSVDIDAGGRVKTVRTAMVEPGGYGFDDAARDAVKQWRFEHSPHGAKNVSLVFNFALPGTKPIVHGESTTYEGGGEGMPLAIYEPSPRYPSHARSEGIEGKVDMLISISTEGMVTNVKLVKCTPTGWGFEEAAMDAARHYKFVPGPKARTNLALSLTFGLPPEMRRHGD